MATADEVKKLAALARIQVMDEELPTFVKEFDAILAYVETISKLEIPEGHAEKPALRNIMREDGPAHESRAFTEKLAEQFPAREGDALVVKQIISHE